MENDIKKGDVFWVNLDPTVGSEMNKTRPAVIISNDVQNSLGIRYIISPITSKIKKVYPFEALIQVNDKKAKALLDQIRVIDNKRLGKFICRLTINEILDINSAIKLVLAIS